MQNRTADCTSRLRKGEDIRSGWKWGQVQDFGVEAGGENAVDDGEAIPLFKASSAPIATPMNP